MPGLFNRKKRCCAGPAEPLPYELAEVQSMAQEGRKLAIYDRATGLYAYWYLQLRGDEETSRAKRYNKRLALLSIWAGDRDGIAAVTASLKQDLRDNDLAGYLNNGHFVVLLLETPPDGADVVCARLSDKLEGMASLGLANFPADGDSFEALLDVAKAKAAPDESVA